MDARDIPRSSASHSRAPDFDRLARVYRWMEYVSFGTLLERCRFRYLQDCGECHRALILGDGDGRSTARLLAENPTLHADAVDCSRAMLTQLERRVEQATRKPGHTDGSAECRLRTICADIRNFSPPARNYDLVVTHFFLDCLSISEVEDLLEGALPQLAPHSLWLVSEFSIPETGWQRLAARLLVGWLYFAFRKLTHLQARKIPDYSTVFLRHGFRRRHQSRFLGGLLSSELWERKVLSPKSIV